VKPENVNEVQSDRTAEAQPSSGAASGSEIEPLSERELATLNAALVLIKRGDIHLAERSLARCPDAKLALDLKAYVARHSPNKD